MARALALAQSGWGQTAPNPMVGAVVVAAGEIVGEGFHARYGEPHAEVIALRAAGERARGATMYVGLEPCAHHGKTPPCTDAIIDARVSRVIAATFDPSREARGGADRLRQAGIDVQTGLLRDQAAELNAPFFNAQCVDRPWVTLKLAVSSDDAIADASGKPRWITSEASRREVHRMRAGSDAVGVGIGTALADDPELTVRDAASPRVPPIPVVFDSALRLPPTARVVRAAKDLGTIVVARHPSVEKRAVLERHGVRIIEALTAVAGLRALRALDIRSVLIEGGARLAGGLLDENLVDRLVIFRSPVRLGVGARPAFPDLPAMMSRLAAVPTIERRTFDEDTMTVYGLRPVPCLPA